ncbi:hypothetical protein D3C72_424310 [compost metagenome]
MKRIFDVVKTDVFTTTPEQLLQMICHSEGRTLMAETVVSCSPLSEGVSNPELAASFGADMITLNTFDLAQPYVEGLYEESGSDDSLATQYEQHAEFIRQQAALKNVVKDLKQITGRFIGCNLEPVPAEISYPAGFRVSKKNLLQAVELGLDYIVITGNPNTMITETGIIDAIRLAKEIAGDRLLIIAGKMHGAGTGTAVLTETVNHYCQAGADIIMLPAPYTTPGMTTTAAKTLIDAVHQAGKLALCAMGTSQEGADRAIVENIAINSKVAGADIIHIGDAGFSGIADPENIKYCSIAIRGKRHTYRRIGLRR